MAICSLPGKIVVSLNGFYWQTMDKTPKLRVCWKPLKTATNIRKNDFFSRTMDALLILEYPPVIATLPWTVML